MYNKLQNLFNPYNKVTIGFSSLTPSLLFIKRTRTNYPVPQQGRNLNSLWAKHVRN